MRSALVLEGGGLRGIFTAGILDVMMEHGIEYDAAIGVSAGAAFGCNYKSHQIGRAVRYNCKYARDWRYCSIRSLILTGDMFGAKFCYHTLPMKLDVMDKEAFESNPMRFTVVCTDVHTGKPVYHDIDTLDEEAMEWMRASASMPLVSRVVHVGGYDLQDGGVGDSIPIEYALKEGYDKIVVITTQPKDYIKHPSGHDRLLRFALRKYPKFARALLDRHLMYNRTTRRLAQLEEAGDIYVIRPESALEIGRIEHDPQRIKATYDKGRVHAETIIEEVKQYLREETA